MSKWLCVLLLTFSQLANAAPAGEEAVADSERRFSQPNLLHQLDTVRHSVVDRTSDLVVTAMGFLGVPYRRGGNNAETGFDCSGLVRAIYGQTIGLVLPRRADEQAQATQTIEKKDLQPGDLVFFNTMRRTFSHVGVYIGEGKFIHAPRTGASVRVESMQTSYWKMRFDGARRVSALSSDTDSAVQLSSNF
ncbi:MAG: C40 family peptidase [Giesbergeria sp.]|nr:C40 family peptidase [Giesbergeria sp.]